MGCADGPFLPTLNHYAKRIVALDISSRHMMRSKILVKDESFKLKNINLIQSDAVNLPFRENQFNLILSFEVLEHIRNPTDAINEIHRILKNNNEFICTVPVEIGLSLLLRTLIGRLSKFKRPKYTHKELIQSVILKKPGLRTNEMEHKNFDWRVIQNQIRKRFEKVKVKFMPINFLKNINPLVLLKGKKT